MFVQLVITALKTHKYDKSIQVTGSAALFYLTNTEYRNDQSVCLRREVIQVVLNGMEQYQEVTVSSTHTVWISSIPECTAASSVVCVCAGSEELLPDAVQLQYSRRAGVSVSQGQSAALKDPGASTSGRVHPAHRRTSV